MDSGLSKARRDVVKVILELLDEVVPGGAVL